MNHYLRTWHKLERRIVRRNRIRILLVAGLVFVSMAISTGILSAATILGLNVIGIDCR